MANKDIEQEVVDTAQDSAEQATLNETDSRIAELEKEIEVPKGLDRNEYLGRVWMYREIKKSGGYAIHAHPYWNIGFYHTSTKMSEAIIKNGLCDAYEKRAFLDAVQIGAYLMLELQAK